MDNFKELAKIETTLKYLTYFANINTCNSKKKDISYVIIFCNSKRFKETLRLPEQRQDPFT